MMFAMMLLCGAVLDGIMPIANSVLAAPLNSLPQIRQQTPAAGTGTFTISNHLKAAIQTNINNGSNAAMVIALVDTNATQFYRYGKMSISYETIVYKNT